jgi:hypothetical protein
LLLPRLAPVHEFKEENNEVQEQWLVAAMTFPFFAHVDFYWEQEG